MDTQSFGNSRLANTNLAAQAGIGRECAIEQRTGLEGILSQSQAILNFVQHQGERIERIDAKLYGAAKPQSTCGQAPVPAGIVSEITYVLESIQARLLATDETVSSISRAI